MTHDENALRAAMSAATASVDPAPDAVRRAREGGRRRLRRHRVQVGAASVLTAAAVVSGVVPLLGGSGPGTTTPQPAASVPAALPTGAAEECVGHQLDPAELPADVLLWPVDLRMEAAEAWPRMETGPCAPAELSLAGVDDDGVIERLAVVFGPSAADLVPADTEPGTLVPGPEDHEAGRRDFAWLLPDGQQLRVDADGFTAAELEQLAAAATVTDGVVDLGDWPAAMGLDYVGEAAPVPSPRYSWEVASPQGALNVQLGSGGLYGWGLAGDRIVELDGGPAVLRGTDHVVWTPSPGVVASLTVADGLDPLEVAATVGPVAADDQRVLDAVAAALDSASEPTETPSEPEATLTR